MKKILIPVLFVLTVLNIFFAAYPLFKGDVHFFNDVARDFHLLRELHEKKIILIGPRSNASGLFHGPLWTYVNFPVFIFSNGNPVAVAWNWILLEIIALIIGYLGVKKLFGALPGWVFAYLYSYSFINHINGMFHSDTPVYLTPLLYLSAVFYAKDKKFQVLLLHLTVAIMIMQLNVGVGIPVLILSVSMSLFLILKNRNWKHLAVFSVIPLFLLNFIIFDFRHDFLLSRSAYEFYNFQKNWTPLPLSFLLRNRLESTVHLQFYYSESFYLALFIFTITILSSIREILLKKLKAEYWLILYFYAGYMILSFTNKGVILSHFIYLNVGLTTIWFASFFRKKYINLFLPVLFILGFLNINHATGYLKELDTSYIGQNFQSWLSMKTAADTIIKKQKGEEFGYYVFAPDAFAYGPRYALIHLFEKTKTQAYEYQKKNVTYLVAEPPPKNDPLMNHIWWRKNPVKITSDPVWTEKFNNGYVIEEYHLTPAEQQIPHDKSIELGIHFR